MSSFEDDQYVAWGAIQRLRARWEKKYSKVAAGGLNAIAGFDYQFVVALRDTVKRWLSEERSRRGEPSVFTEILSDVVEVAFKGPVHVTQVKRTQSGHSVREALEDLWSIYRLVSEFEPGLSKIMDYRIVSARSKISDVRGILSSWKPQDAADTDQILQDFRDRVHIEIDADPESELLTLLANEFRADEPLAATHRWLGRLIHAASTQNGFVAAGKEIWNDLNGLSVAADANKTRPSIYFWQQRDRPPVGVQTGSYLTGERPLPRHLRLGFFANREAVLGPLSAKITAWLTPHPASSDDSLRLPIFWIGGRSGTGKSVALLQVLSRIHAEQIGPILWLGPHIAALPEAIRWSQRVRRPGETVVIALDDPYAPAAQYDAVTLLQQAISELVTARQGDDPTELPVLLCCGPTEQAERFDRELADDIRLTREDLPHENSKDHATLRQWFRERTGSEPPEIGDGDVLLVQLFFEWRVGATLPEFANRLRQRIAMAETSDHEPELTGQFSRILALNRLYVGYPRRAIEQALTAPQRGVFLRLQRENHLVADPDDERPGVWLAHPHLSNAIYAAWHSGSADEPVRRDHLMQGIFSAIEHGENPSQQQSPLWAISRALDSTLDDSTLADRLAGENLVSLLQDIYLTLIKRYSGTLPLTHLPVWIEIRSLHPEIFLEPDPVDAGITALLAAVTGEPGLRLTSHKLLQHLRRYSEDVRTRIADATTFLLGRTTQWREWVPIMLDAIPRFRRPEMGSIIARWVEDHNNHMMVPPLLELGLKHAIGAEIREKALHVIATAGEGIAWGDVALLLLGENAASVPNEVAVWTERHRSTFGVCFVLGRLLNSHYSPAVAWSIEWARIWHLERRANWVLEPLVQFGEGNPNISVWSEAWIRAGYPNAGRLIQLRLKAHSDDTSLRNLSVEWLRQTEYSDGSWSYAWEGLWNSAPGEDELVELGIRWLEATLLEQRSWSFVWFALYRNSPVDAQLRELALRWFASAPPDHVSWAFIWTALDKRAPGDAQLRELALAWLRSAPPGHGSWQYVWTALHEAAPGDAQLRDVALAWLVSAPPDHGSWAFIWLVLDQETPRDAQLRELALGWLASAPPDHGSWKFVWEALNNETPGNAQLRDLALAWLKSAPPDHGSWAFIWEALDKATPGHEKLRDLALRWLASAPPDHGSWAFIWEALDKATPGDTQLRDLALRWLASAPSDHGGWQYVWRALHEAAPGDAQLRDLALRWLASAPPDHGSWAFIWGALDKTAPGDAQLRELALAWLRSAPRGHGSWQYVWTALHEAAPGNAQLRDLAFAWLVCAPPDHGSWAFVWLVLDKETPRDAQLRALALDWLESAPPDHGSWKYVWEALRNETPGDAQLRDLALAWLGSAPPDHGSWAFIWTALDKATPGHAKLRELALAWLASAPPDHGSWAFIWLALDKETPRDPRLRELALDWLRSAPPDHGSWKYVWTALHEGEPGDAQLRDLALAWLKSAPPDHGSWAFIWLALDIQTPRDAQLRELAFAWLRSAPPDHGSWKYIWEALSNETPGDAQLRDLALRWLASAPPDHGSWQYVWTTLDKATPEDPQLREVGLRWLHVAIQHRSWSFVWIPLWNRTPFDEELAELGNRFLQETPEGYFRRSNVKSALRFRHSREHTPQAALDSNASNWPIPWIEDWENGGNRARLLSTGLKWVQESITHPLWASVFIRLWEGGERSDVMRLLGARWIAAYPNGRRGDDVRKLVMHSS